MRRALWLSLALSCLVLLAAPAVRAEATLDVAHDLRGRKLGAQVMVLEDESRALTLEQVRSTAHARDFRPGKKDALRFGFSRSAYWVRLATKNSYGTPRSWLLEVGFPHLDHVTLYVPTGAGYQVRETGDMVPFAQRDLSYRNFVFMLEEPPRTEHVYYLRVATSGVCNFPLTAWTLEQFAAHQHLDWAGLCVFYGIILMMACYNLSLYGFTREREYAYFALFILAMGMFQMTVVGHTFEYLLPNANALAQTAVPVSIAFVMLCTALLGRTQLNAAPTAVREQRMMDRLIFLYGAILVIALFAPNRFSIRFVPVCCTLTNLVCFALLWRVMRSEGQKASLYIWGWSSILLGTLVTLFQTLGLLPENFFTQWAAQIGASVHFVLVAAGMATKLTWLRVELRDANGQLAHKVRALEHAVVRAELATVRAERALRVKDEFMATMSHELRTPLNTIINVPQGLVEDFPLRRYAVCKLCEAHFELEPSELISRETRCPECLTRASLQLSELAVYTGQAARTTRYLETIERSGKHLLQVVNDILRVERTDLSDTELSYSIVEICRLVRDVVDEMRDWAARSGVVLTVQGLPHELELALDPLRIRQVLLNLISNAIKFSNGRGRVTVTVNEHADACSISVQDQGIGIAKDKLDAVFDTYQQAHDSDAGQYGGTGLGLSISRSLVQKHGGALSVESELGQGAKFTFRIPRSERQRRSA